MLVQAAESRFQRGLDALASGRSLEALALFEAAIEVERRAGRRAPQPRYLSYFGLCLAQHGHRPHEGVRLCRRAISVEFFNADLFFNYGRALLITNKRKEAYGVLARGLSVHKNHPAILHELGRMGWRRRPIVSFLSRRHPINVALGKLLRPSGRTDSVKRAHSPST